MSQQSKMVNGDQPHSQFISHLSNYPVVADCSEIYKNNPLGAQSISLAQRLYATFAQPILPYLQTPYSILSPYLAQADHIGDKSLERVDSTFPSIKSTDLNGLKTSAFDLAHYPFKVVGDSREYVFHTYNDEYKKIGGQGITTTGKAVVSTELRIISETMHAVADYLGPKKDAAAAKAQEYRKVGEEKVGFAQKTVQEKKDQARKVVNEQREQMVNGQ